MKLELDNLTVEQVDAIMNVMRKELTDNDWLHRIDESMGGEI